MTTSAATEGTEDDQRTRQLWDGPSGCERAWDNAMMYSAEFN
jgi:hypothetical protein